MLILCVNCVDNEYKNQWLRDVRSEKLDVDVDSVIVKESTFND